MFQISLNAIHDMTYKKRLHALNPCTSKKKAFLKTKKKNKLLLFVNFKRLNFEI